MKRIAYFQCPTGIAGDMCLGALIDSGVPLEYLIEQLKGLGLESEYHLTVEKVKRQAQIATKFEVHLTLQPPQPSLLKGEESEHHHHQSLGSEKSLGSETLPLHDHHHYHHHDHHHHRHLPEIEQLILGANLPPKATQWSLDIFRNLAIAEGKVHGIAPEKVHFHEVGAVDAIIDIVGTCLGLDYLGVEEIYCSPLPTGGGTVKAAHGTMAVPVPAVLELWQMGQVPVYSNGIEKELVTPTGAAIVTTLATQFGNPPAMELEIIGNGAGTKDFAIPNILRLWIGKQKQNQPLLEEQIAVLETQIDDLNPQIFGYVFEQLLAVGALDVFTQPIGMKKSRPGVLLTVITPLEKVSICEQLIFRETTTLGIRKTIQTRSILDREIQEIETKYGKIRVKIAKQNNQIINIQPEYEDCVNLAKKHNLPLKLIQQTALFSLSFKCY